MSIIQMTTIFVVILVVLVKTFAKNSKEYQEIDPHGSYVMVKSFPDAGYEVRRNYWSVWVHITDQERFDAVLREKMRIVHEDVNRLSE